MGSLRISALMWRKLAVSLLVTLAISACARDEPRCRTHKVANGELTECSGG